MKTMIKPWQKAALSVLAGTGIYTGFLMHLSEQTGAANLLKHNLQVQSGENQQLRNAIALEQQQSASLKQQLQSIQSHTAQLQRAMTQTSEEIHKIKAGDLSHPVQISTVPKPAVSTSPPTRAVQHSAPPPVQSVTKASG